LRRHNRWRVHGVLLPSFRTFSADVMVVIATGAIGLAR
jgi:hypothetical protein